MLRTWDIFDTLIARCCIFPKNVFQIVEQVGKVGNFAQVRIDAEKNVLAREKNCTLDLIYEELQRLTNAPKDFCDALKKLECDVEVDQSIPITENIRQVKAGDVLISDMYLPEEIIRRMLVKAGLIAPVEIFISSGGKYSGRVWRQLADQKLNVFHRGDNEYSDLINPRNAKLDAMLDVRARLNIAEQFLLQHDFAFAAYLREIRLRNPFNEEIKRLYWEYFTLNIGTLILIVRHLDALQKNRGFEYLGFCGRDTHYLRLLYERFKRDCGETPVPNDYLYYSRKLAKNSRDEFKKYLRAKINNRKALLIDLLGIGRTFHKLRREGLNFSMLICCNLIENMMNPLYYKMPTELPPKWISFLDNPDEPEEKNSAFYFLGNDNGERYVFFSNELFNRATHNSPVRLSLAQVDEKILPIVDFNPINDTENLDVFEACLQEVLRSKIHWSNLRRKDILEQLLKIFNNMVLPRILRSQHVLEDETDKFVDRFRTK